MATHGTRKDLRRSVIEAFAAQDEIYRICFFGREAEGKHDCYSDIDMVVYSSDLARTKARYKDVFASISPVRATFTLGGTPESYSEMVMLHDYSPYQKVDFSIGDWGLWESHLSVVYDSKEKSRACRSTLCAVEVRQDVAYKLTDVLFSVARFSKCLFRRDVDMYRRWESITNVTLVLLYEKHFGYGIWTHHITQVVENGKRLARLFGADAEIVEIAALLHDYASIKDNALYNDHHLHGPVVAKSLLRRFGYPQERIEAVKECIAAHRGSVPSEKKSVEADCLANADAMAHIGQVPSLLKLAFVQHHMGIDEGARWVRSKLERSWRKLGPQGQDMMRKKYEAALMTLTVLDDSTGSPDAVLESVGQCGERGVQW